MDTVNRCHLGEKKDIAEELELTQGTRSIARWRDNEQRSTYSADIVTFREKLIWIFDRPLYYMIIYSEINTGV